MTPDDSRPLRVLDPEEDPYRVTEDLASWGPVDITEVVDGVADGTLVRPQPTLMHIDGGGALLYPGKVHGVHGVGGSGKTWFAAVGIAECITAGQGVVLVDFEDTPATIVERLIHDLRVPGELVKEHFVYVRPTASSHAGIEPLRRLVSERDVTLVVVDSVGEALANDGVKQNEDDEVARWMRRVPRALADLGPAVLLLDHVPKSDETTLMPIGSQRKQAAMNGAIYSLQVKVPFSRGRAGHAKVVCGKDRQGTYARGDVVAELQLGPDRSGRTNITLRAPRDNGPGGHFRPTALMEKASKYVEAGGRDLTANSIASAVSGKRSDVLDAIKVLVAEGYLATTPGPRCSTLHSSIRPYRQHHDPASDRFQP